MVRWARAGRRYRDPMPEITAAQRLKRAHSDLTHALGEFLEALNDLDEGEAREHAGLGKPQLLEGVAARLRAILGETVDDG